MRLGVNREPATLHQLGGLICRADGCAFGRLLQFDTLRPTSGINHFDRASLLSLQVWLSTTVTHFRELSLRRRAIRRSSTKAHRLPCPVFAFRYFMECGAPVGRKVTNRYRGRFWDCKRRDFQIGSLGAVEESRCSGMVSLFEVRRRYHPRRNKRSFILHYEEQPGALAQ